MIVKSQYWIVYFTKKVKEENEVQISPRHTQSTGCHSVAA